MDTPELPWLSAPLMSSMEPEKTRNEKDERYKQDYILQSILDCTASIIYIKDLEGKYLFINHQFEDLFQISKDQVIGKTDYDLFPKDTADKFRKNDWDVQRKKRQIEFEEEVLHDEKVLSYNSVKFPLFTQNKKVFAVCGISTDITERKKIEAALHEANIRNQALLEGSPICNKIIDLDSRLQYMSPAGQEMLKINDITPFYGTKFPPDFYPETTKSTLTEQLERAKQGETTHTECQATDIEGNEVWFQTSFVPARNDEGRVKYILATSVDITDRKQAEKALRSADIKNHTLLEGSPVCTKIFDLDNRLQYMSPAGQKMLRIDDITQFYGTKYPPEFFPEPTRIQINKHMEQAKKGEASALEFQAADTEGNEAWFQSCFVPVLNDLGHVEYIIGTSIEITDRKITDELLRYQAHHDELTGLVNRGEFERQTERLLTTIKQTQSEHALCFMDLDQFKIVNDTCGHAAGDEMLRQISAELKRTIRQSDTIARLGGDEFGVLMECCSLEDAQRVALSLQKTIQDFVFSWEGRNFRVGVSMGLVPITKTTSNFTELLKQADIACYVAKDMGRNRIHTYNTRDSEITQRHGEMKWVNQIHHALDEGRFFLFAQSISPLDERNNKNYELLIRMQGEQGEVIPPGAFLPAVERYNLASKIDCWVVDKAVELLEKYPLFLKEIGFCSINLSGQSLTDIRFQDFVFNKLKDAKILFGKICFEITETAAITNLHVASQFISKMKQLGCLFALDDFGSGLSSFGYLKNMKVDYLKIDGMFVKDIVDDRIDHAMVKAINEIGQVMGMKTIAEFVENDEIKGMLREIGVNYVQGFGINKPIRIEDLLFPYKTLSLQ